MMVAVAVALTGGGGVNGSGGSVKRKQYQWQCQCQQETASVDTTAAAMVVTGSGNVDGGANGSSSIDGSKHSGVDRQWWWKKWWCGLLQQQRGGEGHRLAHRDITFQFRIKFTITHLFNHSFVINVPRLISHIIYLLSAARLFVALRTHRADREPAAST